MTEESLIILAHIGYLVTCLLAVYVGLRTLRLWTRTRMIPELSIETSVLSIAIAGVVFATLEGMHGDKDGPLPMIPSAIGVYLTASVGLVGSAAVAFAFFPPSAYIKLVEGRSFSNDAAEVSQ